MRRDRELEETDRPAAVGRRAGDQDLVDLLLMEALVTHDYVALREACELVFRSRNTHPWPPDLATMPSHWTEPFTHLAVELDLADTDVDMALVRVRDFVARILRSSA